MKRSLIAVPLVAVAFAASASGASAKSVTALGAATVKVAPAAKNSAAIGAAVAAARKQAGPLALAEARERALDLAAASGLTLGALTAVAEQPPSPFYYYGPFGVDGTFGPGKYCGKERRPIFSNKNGKRRVVKYRTRWICRPPREVTASVSATFDAT